MKEFFFISAPFLLIAVYILLGLRFIVLQNTIIKATTYSI